MVQSLKDPQIYWFLIFPILGASTSAMIYPNPLRRQVNLYIDITLIYFYIASVGLLLLVSQNSLRCKLLNLCIDDIVLRKKKLKYNVAILVIVILAIVAMSSWGISKCRWNDCSTPIKWLVGTSTKIDSLFIFCKYRKLNLRQT